MHNWYNFFKQSNEQLYFPGFEPPKQHNYSVHNINNPTTPPTIPIQSNPQTNQLSLKKNKTLPNTIDIDNIWIYNDEIDNIINIFNQHNNYNNLPDITITFHLRNTDFDFDTPIKFKIAHENLIKLYNLYHGAKFTTRHNVRPQNQQSYINTIIRRNIKNYINKTFKQKISK